jgi:hypothetical protein
LLEIVKQLLLCRNGLKLMLLLEVVKQLLCRKGLKLVLSLEFVKQLLLSRNEPEADAVAGGC